MQKLDLSSTTSNNIIDEELLIEAINLEQNQLLNESFKQLQIQQEPKSYSDLSGLKIEPKHNIVINSYFLNEQQKQQALELANISNHYKKEFIEQQCLKNQSAISLFMKQNQQIKINNREQSIDYYKQEIKQDIFQNTQTKCQWMMFQEKLTQDNELLQKQQILKLMFIEIQQQPLWMLKTEKKYNLLEDIFLLNILFISDWRENIQKIYSQQLFQLIQDKYGWSRSKDSLKARLHLLIFFQEKWTLDLLAKILEIIQKNTIQELKNYYIQYDLFKKSIELPLQNRNLPIQHRKSQIADQKFETESKYKDRDGQ